MDRWVRAAGTAGAYAVAGQERRPEPAARLVEVLPDGSTLVELAESDAMLLRRRATCGDRGLLRLRPILTGLGEGSRFRMECLSECLRRVYEGRL
ncbi:hypothetical protein GCM10027290_17310 [Micromonospora sonneratiae]